MRLRVLGLFLLSGCIQVTSEAPPRPDASVVTEAGPPASSAVDAAVDSGNVVETGADAGVADTGPDATAEAGPADAGVTDAAAPVCGIASGVAGAATNQALLGSPWQTPNAAIGAFNGAPTAAALGGASGSTSSPLVLSSFALVVPEGASVKAVRVTVRRGYDGVGGGVVDDKVQLSLGGAIGDGRARSTPWPNSFSDAVYGDVAGDLWGTNLQRADVISSTFGVVLSAKSAGLGESIAQVDGVKLEVAYCVP